MTPTKRRTTSYPVVVEDSSGTAPSEDASGEEKLAWLRSQWRLAAIAQFTYSFVDALKLDDPFTTDLFEEALLQSGEPNEFLMKYLIKLLRLVHDNRFIYADNYLNYMKRVFEQKAHLKSGPLVSFEKYSDLSLQDRLEAFYIMTEMALVDSDRIRLLCDDDEEEQEHWRVEPVGYDKFGNAYWLFDDNRLFCARPTEKQREEGANKKQKTNKKKGKRKISTDDLPKEDPNLPRWELVCRTVADWKTYPLKFADSTDKDEKELYATLTESLQPVIVKELQAEAKRVQKMFMEEVGPMKRSTRLQAQEIERIRYSDADDSEEATSRSRSTRQQEQSKEEVSLAEQRQARLLEREMRKYKQVEEEFWETREEPSKKSPSPVPDNDDSWAFLCPCGVVGENIDDGQPMMECDVCGTWAHIHCIDHLNKKLRRPKKNWDVDAYVCELCLEKRERQEALENSMEVDVVTHDDEHDLKISYQQAIVNNRAPSPVTAVIQDVLEKVCSSLPEESI